MHKFNVKNIEKLDNPERRRTMPPEQTLKKFNIEDDGVLLDVGCGIGYFTIPAAKILKNNRVIGIDIMPEILKIAKENAEGRRNIEFKESKEYSFPIEDNSVKYVLIGNVIHEVEDKIKYFKEVKRVLKKDGYLLIIDWDKKEMKMGPPVHERISKVEMIELCRQAGFKEAESIDVSPNHYGIKVSYS
ncbi:class I SAM-dependent methyltransferase [Candidatus Clostridium radicumherbarum]|uniref:Class I SAM-dependent methyltransferase n=1 Tax=Candidatus Clostridium radicumherbarum TaxID=3381662 RepID=A0ABW8TUR3_9CLOT